MTGRMLAAWLAAATVCGWAGEQDQWWALARDRGRIYDECGRGASRLLKGWYRFKRDPDTGLYSRDKGTWDYQDEAADHYGSLVLIAYFVDTPAIAPGGILHQTLRNSIRLCSTPSGIPAPYDIRKKVKLDPGPGKEEELVFGAAEWCKDGLNRTVETLGTDNDWYAHLLSLSTAIMKWSDRQRSGKGLPANVEIRGNMLQVLPRLYTMSGDEQLLRWAEDIGDEYLLADPLQKIGRTSLRDHGCELIGGLGELFALECQLKRPKARAYQPAMRKLLDRILEVGRDKRSGLWREWVDVVTGTAEGGPPDTWGYALFAYENYDRGTGEKGYTAAIEKPMRWLIENRPGWTNWDDWSDSYESMMALWKRYPDVQRVFAWLHWMTERHRSGWMEPYGPYSGGHFDGSTGRTLVIHMNLASQGVRTVPYMEGLRLGGVQEDGGLYLSAESDVSWRGRLCFDWPRSEHKFGKVDWARINETPEWYTVRPQLRYRVTVDGGAPATLTGKQLIEGFALDLKPGSSRRIRVQQASAQ